MMLSEAQAEHSALAQRHLVEQIEAAGGWLSFEQFMELALYAPGLGYYSGGAQKLGKGGDFTTAPEISSLFGRCVALQSADVLRALHAPRILEIGAGTGSNFRFYSTVQAGASAEPSREMLKIARNKTRPDGMALVQSCAESLPFESNSFDAALATLVLCSVKSPQQSLSELRRVVKTGGTIVLLEHVRPGGLLGPVFDLLNFISVPLFDDHINRRTAAAARAVGLQTIQVEKHMLGIMNLIVCRV